MNSDRTSAARPDRTLAGLTRLIALELRTGWPGLVGVTMLCAGLVIVVTGSINELYSVAAEREQYAATLGASPASQAFNGRGYGLATTGGIAAYEIGFIGQLLFPFLAVYVAVRHTRREEEAGRTELLTAGRVARLTPLCAGATIVLATSLLTGVLSAAGMTALGLPLAGASWYGAGIVGLMAFFGAAGLALAQLTQSARTAYLGGLAVVTFAFLLRALVDGMGLTAVWLSPLGWLAEVRAFGDPQSWPLGAYAVGAIVLFGLAAHVASRRDLGAGIIPPRRGPRRAGGRLGTPGGMAWRLNRSMTYSWALLAVLWAGIFGGLTREMTQLIEANPSMLEAMGVERGADIVTSLAMVVVCLAATATCVQGMGRLSDEETSDRLGALLATPTPRSRLWLTWWSVVTVAALAVLALGCLALGLATWAATGDLDAVGRTLGVSLGYGMPIVFVAAFAAALQSMSKRWAGLGWVLVGWIAVVGFLDDTLRLPEWARHLSPLYLVGSLPEQDPDLWAIAGLTVAALVLVAGSLLVFGRRDLRAH